MIAISALIVAAVVLAILWCAWLAFGPLADDDASWPVRDVAPDRQRRNGGAEPHRGEVTR